MTYFNWDELLFYSKKDMAAIICLVYAQTKVYNEYSSRTLMKKLNIHHMPPHLFTMGIFRPYKHLLYCDYVTKEPQSYFKNHKFLFAKVPVRDKVVYLRALSMRKPTDTNDYIPRDYYRKVNKNFFLNITEDKIYFPYESSL